jgi:transposase
MTKLQLNETLFSQVEHAIRSDKRTEVRQPATVIRLPHLGKGPKEVSEVLASGLEDLASRSESGSPSIADEQYCQVLEETLEKEPAELGYEFALWTVDRLKLHLDKVISKRMSANRLQVLLQKLGYRYRRPKYELTYLQDGEAKEKAEGLLEELKKKGSETISSFSLLKKQP